MRSRLTRREFGALAISALPGLKTRPAYANAAYANAAYTDATYAGAVYKGVRFGVQTYSFRDVPPTPGRDAIDGLIDAIRQCGFTECELYAPQVGDRHTSLSRCEEVGRTFKTAGISVYAFNISPTAKWSDEELDRMFLMANALGAQIIASSTQLDTAKRIAPFAERHQMIVAMHGHANLVDPNQFAKPESFEAALGMSPYFRINLDIGHFTEAGYDAVPFIEAHRSQITNFHIKDMRRRKPDSYVPWGEGDAPITEVLRLIQRERLPIRAYIEYEYQGRGTPVDEVKRCFDYAKRALV